MNDHNTNWRDAWKQLLEEGLILAETTGGMFTSDFRLTDKGMDHCMSPEQKELQQLMEKPVETNEEHQDRIKKCYCEGWNGRGVEIFDLLLKHGSCKRKEIAALIGISDRGANFHYSLKALLDHKFVEKDPNLKGNIRLSDEAFLSLDDRPDPVEMDPEALAAGMDKVYGKELSKVQESKGKEKQAAAAKKGPKGSKKGRKKEEESPEQEHGKETEDETTGIEADDLKDKKATNVGEDTNDTEKSKKRRKKSENNNGKVSNSPEMKKQKKEKKKKKKKKKEVKDHEEDETGDPAAGELEGEMDAPTDVAETEANPIHGRNDAVEVVDGEAGWLL
jgi:hypothetical protein